MTQSSDTHDPAGAETAALQRRRRRRLRGGCLVLLGVPLLLAVAVGGVMLGLEWKPPPLSLTPVTGRAELMPVTPRRLRLLSWNIGYGALGRDADFFMDGGHKVRPSHAGQVRRNLDGVARELRREPADVVLLQEVDRRARRSHGVDEVGMLTDALRSHAWSRAANFKVPWVPIPLLDPIGNVDSGLLSLSRVDLRLARRHSLPGEHPWPVRVFHLKRCVHELRLADGLGSDWVVLHLHLSAFDAGGHLRVQQLAYLRELMLRLAGQGHPVILGGDWNHSPPGVSADSFAHQDPAPEWLRSIPADWTPPGWRWAVDPGVPTVRALDQPYVAGQTFVATVDAFLLSPKVELHAVATRPLGFTHSDHQPVRITVSRRLDE